MNRRGFLKGLFGLVVAAVAPLSLVGGVVRRFTVDPAVGFQAVDLFKTGYIYAPYIPFSTVPTVCLDEFRNRPHGAGMQLNPAFFRTAVIKNDDPDESLESGRI